MMQIWKLQGMQIANGRVFFLKTQEPGFIQGNHQALKQYSLMQPMSLPHNGAKIKGYMGLKQN